MRNIILLAILLLLLLDTGWTKGPKQEMNMVWEGECAQIMDADAQKLLNGSEIERQYQWCLHNPTSLSCRYDEDVPKLHYASQIVVKMVYTDPNTAPTEGNTRVDNSKQVFLMEVGQSPMRFSYKDVGEVVKLYRRLCSPAWTNSVRMAFLS